jgi:nitrite reductase (NADH) large subunit
MPAAPEIVIEAPKAAPPTPAVGGRPGVVSSRRRAARATETIVVIGNGMAGHKFCDAMVARDARRRYSLVVFGEEAQPAYDRVRLTQFLSGQSPESLTLASRDWYEENHIKLHLGDSVVLVDRDRKMVHSADGRTVRYDKLVFATGASPWVPPMRGRDLPGVFVYRTLNDLAAIKAYATRCRQAAVLGGGLLGLEAAKAMSDLGLKTRVIERGTGLLARQLDPRASDLLQEHVEALGITTMLNRETMGIEAIGDDRLLYLNTNEVVRIQLVILAAGIRPRDSLAADCGLKIASRGGIEVDDWLQTSDPDICAVGECASHKGMVCGLAAPSLQMADLLAGNLCGKRQRYAGATFSTRLKLAGIEVATLGSFQGEGDALTCHQDGSYRRLVFDGSRLVGAIGVGPWPDVPRIQEAVERRMYVWPWQRDRFTRTGRLWKDPTPLPVAEWPATALVCNCKTVRCDQLREACAAGCRTVEQLAARTGASTVCGSCRPLLAELVGAQQTFAPVRGTRLLLGAVTLAFVLVAALLLLPRMPMADTVQGGWKLDILWRDAFWKQVTGFSLLGVSLLSLVLSLRKRIRFLKLGDFGHWRAVHAALGVITLLLLVTHTGLRLGHNLNFVLMVNFLALALLGALAGAVTALERRMSGPAGRRLRAFWTGAHIAMTWPLPALVLFRALKAYYF